MTKGIIVVLLSYAERKAFLIFDWTTLGEGGRKQGGLRTLPSVFDLPKMALERLIRV